MGDVGRASSERHPSAQLWRPHWPRRARRGAASLDDRQGALVGRSLRAGNRCSQ
jgi:hypothetical protein